MTKNQLKKTLRTGIGIVLLILGSFLAWASCMLVGEHDTVGYMMTGLMGGVLLGLGTIVLGLFDFIDWLME